MIDWLAIWGVQQISGFAFKSVLETVGKQLTELVEKEGEDFIKDVLKDFFKDSLKDSLTSGLSRFKKDALTEAMGKAYGQFLYLIQQELEAEEDDNQEIENYTNSLTKFIGDKNIKQWLGKAFDPNCQKLESNLLQTKWNELELKRFTEDFDWKRISKLYLKRVNDIVGESQELKDLFSAKKLQEIATNTIS